MKCQLQTLAGSNKFSFPLKVLIVSLFMVFSAIFNEGIQLERTFRLHMENAVKLFSQIYSAQSFQFNIGYYT